MNSWHFLCLQVDWPLFRTRVAFPVINQNYKNKSPWHFNILLRKWIRTFLPRLKGWGEYLETEQNSDLFDQVLESQVPNVEFLQGSSILRLPNLEWYRSWSPIPFLSVFFVEHIRPKIREKSLVYNFRSIFCKSGEKSWKFVYFARYKTGCWNFTKKTFQITATFL